MSGGHFAGILTPLTCRGSKGQSPLASLGTAQRLAPVQSGLPLCETCLSSPHHWTDTHQAIFSTLRYQIKMEMTVVLWCRDRLWKKEKSSHFDWFSLSETGCSCITPMRSIGQSCAVSGTLYFFFALLIQRFPSANASLPYFAVISAFLFLNHFPFLLKSIKIAVMNISLIFTNRNAITAITFFCYSVSVKLSLLSVYFSITAILFCRKFQTGHAINSPVS